MSGGREGWVYLRKRSAGGEAEQHEPLPGGSYRDLRRRQESRPRRESRVRYGGDRKWVGGDRKWVRGDRNGEGQTVINRKR